MNLSPLTRPVNVMNQEELHQVIDVCLWAGALLLQNGANAHRVEKDVHRLGTALGCEALDILVSPNAIVITVIHGDEYRTKLRRVSHYGVNLTIVSGVNRVSRRAAQGELDITGVQSELARISGIGWHYNRWLVVALVGLACAAFSQLMGGDTVTFFIVWLAASLAMFVRQELTKRNILPLIIVVVTAFVAGLAASSVSIWRLSPHPDIALAASVLLLVPGVPLINAAADLLEGHIVTGMTRGMMGALISMAIALGLLLAIRLTGITGL